MNSIFRPISVFAGLTAALSAFAAPATYTSTIVGSGVLDGTAYTNALVTITATANTNAVGWNGFLFFVNATPTVTVAGLGSDTLTSPDMVVYNNPTAPVAGFGQLGFGTVLGTFDPSFSTYDLTSSIGPVSNSYFDRPDLTFATSNGSFSLTSASGNSTFTAQVVPEPATFAALGLGAVAVLRRRRKA